MERLAGRLYTKKRFAGTFVAPPTAALGVDAERHQQCLRLRLEFPTLAANSCVAQPAQAIVFIEVRPFERARGLGRSFPIQALRRPRQGRVQPDFPHSMPNHATPLPPMSDVMKRLDALVDWERSSRLHMRVDLAPIADLLSRLGDPQKRFRSVHVTGSKGKGSVCSLIDAGLRQSGLGVGRYGSPHLEKVNERIHIDGQQIPDALLTAALASVFVARDDAVDARSAGAESTWFDVVTATAFVAFAEAGVDWAVVEVGIGGRLDSTNVLSSSLAVITNVGLEHTDILGDTVEEIATAKAGIIKAGTALVTSIAPSSKAGIVVYAEASSRGAKARHVNVGGNATVTEINLAIARAVLDTLGELGVRGADRITPVGAADLSESSAKGAAMPGRMERFQVSASDDRTSSTVILDGAHVDFALDAVLRELRRDRALTTAPVVLLALGHDKNAHAMLAVLRDARARLICVELIGGRPSWNAFELVDIATSLGIVAEEADTPEAGLERCLELAQDTWVLVTGSLHLVGHLRTRIARRAGLA